MSKKKAYDPTAAEELNAKLKEREDSPFKKVVSKDGDTWYYNPHYVWCHNINDQTGLYGSVKAFRMEDGSVEFMKGPWLASPKAFEAATGIVFDNAKYEDEL